MRKRGKEPLQKLIQQVRILEEMGRHEQADALREEIMERLRTSVGRGVRWAN